MAFAVEERAQFGHQLQQMELHHLGVGQRVLLAMVAGTTDQFQCRASEACERGWSDLGGSSDIVGLNGFRSGVWVAR